MNYERAILIDETVIAMKSTYYTMHTDQSKPIQSKVTESDDSVSGEGFRAMNSWIDLLGKLGAV